SITLFVFATLLADDRYRTIAAVVEVGAALLFVLLHRIVALERSDGWVDDGRARAGWSLLRAGLVVGVAAVVLGTVVAPHLPGADEEPMVDWRRDSDDEARTLTSPLVDIRKRLVDTSNTLLFTVDSPSPSYWRIAALDLFNGTQWNLRAQTDEIADGDLDVDVSSPRTDTTEVRQQVTLDNLETEWLPAAYQAVGFDPQDAPTVRFDRETSTFISETSVGSGTSYDVTSVLPDLTPEQLRSADTRIPRDVQPQLDLPSDFSPTAADLAREIAGDAPSPFDAALALQDFFRDSGGFTYSTDIAPSPGTDPIDEFLDTRIGYCEQFAGTFAAMARSLDIPARVAVGYTWGETDPAAANRYRVLGRNAHAWPEVYLGEYGWVPFEPTPGRGNPDAESYTNVAGSQDDESPVIDSTTTTTAAPATTSTTLPADLESAAPQASASTTSAERSLRSFLVVVVLLVAAVGVYLLAVPGAIAVRRRRRRARAATSPSAQVGVAWSEAVDSLTVAGVAARPDETHTELAHRAAASLPTAAAPMQDLARLADAAAYGPTATSEEGVAAEALATEVHQAVDATIGRRGRLRRFLDPRPLWSGRRRRHLAD
ncbi:MAG TPA: DUF3488 and transglutaminase-like domain-containing protein, partial [Acidimicrobiales bacterium]